MVAEATLVHRALLDHLAMRVVLDIPDHLVILVVQEHSPQ